jgi:hypothetical protein
MKVTNISPNTLFLKDLRFIPQAQTEGRRDAGRYIGAGSSVYLPNTSEVLRSAMMGDLRAWKDAGLITLEDIVPLANGASTTIVHPFGFPPVVYVLKQVGLTWVDATGTFDLVHNTGAPAAPSNFTSVTLTNTSGGPLTYLIRLA